MKSYEEIKAIINYFLAGNNITKTAAKFNVSRKTILNTFALITSPSSKYYDSSLSEKINLTHQKLLLESRKEAGSKSKRPFVIQEEEINKILSLLFEDHLSLRDIAKLYNCSHTSIVNTLKRYTGLTLDELRLNYKEGETIWKR